jgi:hypothetical protein
MIKKLTLTVAMMLTVFHTNGMEQEEIGINPGESGTAELSSLKYNVEICENCAASCPALADGNKGLFYYVGDQGSSYNFIQKLAEATTCTHRKTTYETWIVNGRHTSSSQTQETTVHCNDAICRFDLLPNSMLKSKFNTGTEIVLANPVKCVKVINALYRCGTGGYVTQMQEISGNINTFEDTPTNND